MVGNRAPEPVAAGEQAQPPGRAGAGARQREDVGARAADPAHAKVVDILAAVLKLDEDGPALTDAWSQASSSVRWARIDGPQRVAAGNRQFPALPFPSRRCAQDEILRGSGLKVNGVQGEYGLEGMTRRVASTDEPDEPTQSGTVLVAVDGSESGACRYSVRSK